MFFYSVVYGVQSNAKARALSILIYEETEDRSGRAVQWKGKSLFCQTEIIVDKS